MPPIKLDAKFYGQVLRVDYSGGAYKSGKTHSCRIMRDNPTEDLGLLVFQMAPNSSESGIHVEPIGGGLTVTVNQYAYNLACRPEGHGSNGSVFANGRGRRVEVYISRP